MSIMIKIRKKLNKGFTLMEVMIGVTLFSIFFSSIFFSLSSLIQINTRLKNRVYQGFENTGEISEKYYFDEEE